MGFRAIIFDLDGTLLDTLADLAAAANHALEQGGYPLHETAQYRYFIGDGAAELIRRALPEADRDGETIDTLLASFLTYYGAHWHDRTKPFDGIPEMLDTLAEKGVRMGVFSNKPDHFAKTCVDSMLPQWTFDPIFGQKEGRPLKPDPQGALEMAKQLDVPSKEILFLGDSSVDMKTGLAAGMVPVGALWGFQSADELKGGGAKALIKHPLELITFMGEEIN